RSPGLPASPLPLRPPRNYGYSLQASSHMETAFSISNVPRSGGTAVAAASVWSVDPRTGKQREQVAVEATAQEVDAAVRAAHEARDALADRGVRAAFLRSCADELEAAREGLVETADAETALGPVRLNGELARTCYQLRAFAGIVEEGAFLDVIIDHPDDSATPPVPDLRRFKVPLGVVAVYSASNFPFA